MATKRSKAPKRVTREKLLQMVREAFKAANGQRMTFQKFLADSGMTEHHVFVHFPTWTALLGEIGLEAPYNQRVHDDIALADWGNVVRKTGRCPTHKEYAILGKYSYHTLRCKFGTWPTIGNAFRKFAGDKSEWADVLPLIHKYKIQQKKQLARRYVGKKGVSRRIADRPSSGAPLDLEAMRHAPSNETGVVFLFGIVARKLGFVVDSLQAGFPDCQAKREIRPDLWKPVAIEFEYESRNFPAHGHPQDGCDIIVCWRHNWADCPKDLQVVELEKEIKKLNHEGHEEHEG